MNGGNWKGILLLSAILPVGLLAVFRFSGFLHGPLEIAEAVTLAPVEWEFNRSSVYVPLHKVLQASYSDSCLSGTFETLIWSYLKDDTLYNFDSITVTFEVNFSGGNPNVSIENVQLVVNDTYRWSAIDLQIMATIWIW